MSYSKIKLIFTGLGHVEKLAQVQSTLPAGVNPVIGPDAAGVGHVYWYHLMSDKYDLGELVGYTGLLSEIRFAVS
ncbi:MAG: hypothetical protein R3A12_12730 [Ignavibacteria bacterium]